MLNEIERRIKKKIEITGVPLKEWEIQINYGIKTGFNEGFIIDGITRGQLLKKCPEADSIIRPIIRGRDIKSYNLKHEDKWIIFTRKGVDISLYPAVEEHLMQYYENLKPRNNGETSGRKPGPYKWYEIQDNVAYYKDFDKDKIIWIELTDKPNFALDSNGYYINNTIFFITGNHLKYLLAFLNSKLCEWYFDKIAATSGVGTRRWIKIYIDQICVPHPTDEIEKRLNTLVDSMHIEKSDHIRDQIDREIYRMFSLSETEIELVANAEL